MDFRVLVRAVPAILLAALCGCGHGRESAVQLPDSWKLAGERMSRISEPHELLSAGGPDASPEFVAEAWGVLDSLQLRSERKHEAGAAPTES